MTTILSVLIANSVVHVSDRLVTAGDRPWDPFSNKTVVHWGKLHFVAIGYTGSAFAGTTPTDQWIAEQLTGQELDEIGAMQIGTSQTRKHAFDVVESICSAANDAFSATTAPPEFLIDGWQERKGLPRPISISLKRGTDGYRAEWAKLPYYLTAAHKFSFRSVGNLHQEDRHRAIREISDCQTLEDVRDVLVQTIRRTNDRTRLTGRDVMTVIAPMARTTTSGCLRVTARFEPSEARIVVLRHLARSGATNPIRVDAFSPWIVHPWGIFAPAIVGVGRGPDARWQIPADSPQLEILFETPDATPTDHWFHFRQQRRQP